MKQFYLSVHIAWYLQIELLKTVHDFVAVIV